MGGSLGATIPKEIADRLHLQVGDKVFVIETGDGILLTPYDPELERAMDAYKRTAGKYRNALRDLAKKRRVEEPYQPRPAPAAPSPP